MSPGSPSFPAYPSIVTTVLKVLGAGIFRSKRSLRADTLPLISRVTPGPKTLGIDNIPVSGGFLIVVNHYSRPGFNTAWNALSISAEIEKEITFIMSEEWAFEGNPLGFFLRPVMRGILSSITSVYSFLSMPSMMEGFSTPASRAAAVRRVIKFVQSHPDAVIGLSPEGQDSPAEGVGLAPDGGGKFMLRLNRMGFPLLPVVIAERSGRLVLHFGRPFDFPASLDERSASIDLTIRSMVRDTQQTLFDNLK
jgi:hypothetical protein